LLAHFRGPPRYVVRMDDAKPGSDTSVICIRLDAQQCLHGPIEIEQPQGRIPVPGADTSRRRSPPGGLTRCPLTVQPWVQCALLLAMPQPVGSPLRRSTKDVPLL